MGDVDRNPDEPDATVPRDAEALDAGAFDAAPPTTPREAGAPSHPSAPQPCGEAAHGVMEQRQRYAHAVVSHYAGCVPEVQVRTCRDGMWTQWSGTAREEQCAVALFGACSDQVSCAEGQCVNTDLFTKQCLATNGMKCSDNAECVSRCIDGVCADPAPAGGRCDEAADCDVLACVGGSGRAFCENATCVCPNGSLCTSNAQCQGTCVGLKCVDPGTSCDANDDDDCDALSSCVNRRCLRPDGTSCDDNAQCENVCVEGTCAPRSGVGEACDENADCDDGLECASKGPGPGPGPGPGGPGPGPGASVCREVKSPPCPNPEQCESQVCACAGDTGQDCLCDEAASD